MKAVTAFFVVFALVMIIASPAFAAKGASAAQPQVLQRETGLVQLVTEPESPLPVRVQTEAVLAPIAPGTYTIGAAGTYPTLSAAVAALNLNGVTGTGTVIFEFIDPAYTDTGVTIGGYLNQGATGLVIFRPAPGVVARIKFSGGSSGNTFGVRLDSASYVTFDGSNSGGSDRSLTLEIDTLGTVNKFGILVQRTSNFITLKNLVVIGNRRAALSGGSDIIRIANTSAATAAQHDITVDNCRIYRGASGIIAIGRNTALLDYNLTFTNNLIGGAGSASTLDNTNGNTGAIGLQRVSNVLIDRNEIYGSKRWGGSSYGLLILGAANGVTFTRNKVHGIWVLSGGGAARMIAVQGQETTAPAVKTNLYVANNFFYDNHNIGTGSGGRSIQNIIYFPTGGTAGSNGSNVTLVNNTFWYKTTTAEATSGTCFMFDGNAFGGNAAGNPDTLIMRNNISATDRDTNFTRQFLIFEPVDPANFTWISNNNLFYQDDLGSFGQYPTPWPTGPSGVNPTFADWQTITGNDAASAVGNPEFISSTDPHINTAIGIVSAADSLAAPYPGITADIDGDVRNLVAPDAGADEFTVTRYTLDLGAVSVDYPPPTQIIAAGAPFSPKATFVNPGTVTHAAAPVKIEIFNSVPALVYTGTATIAVGGYDNIAQATFAPPAVLAAGNYTITATALLPGDLRPSNDSKSSTLFVQASISTLPYSYGFESGLSGWLTTTPGGPNDWVIGTPAKTQIAGAKTGTQAWVTKVTGNYTDNQESYVNAPILNLSTFTGTLLVQFASNFKTEADFDGGDLQISTNGGFSWTKVDSLLGTGTNFDTPTSSAWYNDNVADGNISAPYWGGGEAGGVGSAGYSTQSAGWVTSATAISGLSGLPDVRFRWHFSSDGGVNSEGWAIDDVVFRSLLPDDISVASVSIPGYVGGPVPDLASVSEPNVKGRNGQSDPQIDAAPGLGAFTATPITFDAVVRNAGVNAQPAFTVGWGIDGAPQAPVANTGVLPFAGTQTLPLVWATPTTGFHNVRAYTQLGTDTNPSNDSSSFNFEVLAPEVVLYEGFNGTTFPPAGWDTLNVDGNTGSVTSWYRSTGAPKEGAASARANFNGANGFYIDEWLITPNTGSLLETSFTVDSLSFYAKNFTGSIYPESLMVLVSTSTADRDSFFSMVLGYFEVPSAGYGKFTFALPNAANRYIAFRRLLYDGGPSGNSSDNMYLDDVRITRYSYANTFSATPSSLGFGLLPIGFTATQTVKVKNPGNLPLNIVGVASSDPTNFAVVATPGTIAPGDSTTVSVTFQPTTVGALTADIIFVHDADSTPDTVVATGQGSAALTFTSLTPDSVLLENPLKLASSIKPAGRFKGFYPNWSNLLDEIVAQGAFRPGTSESDSAGGARIGLSFMYQKAPGKWAVDKAVVGQWHWMRLTKWDATKGVGKSFNALQKTLVDKTGRHTGSPRGLDYTTDGKNKPLKGQYAKLLPKTHNNALVAEMVALKVNIAASAIGKTPAGFGELVFNRPGHPFDGRTVKQISAKVDSMLTIFVNPFYAQASYDSALLAVSLVNRAFVGPLDTVSWEAGGKGVAQLVVKGAVNLAAVPYLALPPGPFVASRITPANNLTESLNDFGDEEFEDEESMPVAAKLYQNYPNPFNPTTTIAFRLREESKVSIRIFNLLGQQVATLIDGEELEEGMQEVQFAGTNLASGIYFYQIDAQGLGDDAMKTIETRKMVLVK